MTVTLQIVSPLDQSTVLLDLNDYAAANATSLVPYTRTEVFSNVSMGSPVLDASKLDPANLDTTFTTFSRRAEAPVTIGVHITASSVDNMTRVVGALAQYLSQGCVIKWIPTGANQTAFLDVLPSQTPVLLNGQELALQQLVNADTQNDLTIQFTRQAYLRFAKLDPALNRLVTNPLMLRDSNQDGTPDGWTLTSTPTVSIVTATESCHIVAGAAGRGIFQNTAAASFAPGDPGTVAIDVKVASGTAAVILDWRTNADATISNVTVTTTSAGWTRIPASSGSAPATTDHVRFRVESSGAAATFDVRCAQAEKTASASPFRVCPETIALDPATAGMTKMMPVYNPGTAWAPLEITTSFPDASTAVQQLSYALLSSSTVPGADYLADFLNGPYYGQAEANGNGWTLTPGTNTTLVGDSDAGSSPGSGTTEARISHTTSPNTTQMAIRWSRTTLLNCLRGTFRAYIRCHPTANANSIYDLAIKWGTGGGIVQNANDTYVLDNSASAATAYRLLYLGDIVLPDDFTSPTLSSLQIELWSNMDGAKTAQNLDIDYLLLMPTEDVAMANLGAGTSDAINGASLTTPPKQLGAPTSDPAWTSGTVNGTALNLTAANQAAGWGTNTAGLFTGVGSTRHLLQAACFLSPGTSATMNFQVANITDATIAATVSKTVGSGVTQWRPSLVFTDVAGKVYQPRVTLTAISGAGVTGINNLGHQISPAIVQNQKARMDPGSVPPRYAAEQLDSSGNLIVTMNATRIPFWIPPGLSLLMVDAWDSQADSNDLELQHINARTLSVSPAVYPRNWV